MRFVVSVIFCALVAFPTFAQRGDKRGEEQNPLPSHWKIPPAPILSPEEQLETFQLAESNLTIELFASEPMVQDPVAMEFDERGRLWVVEMRGYMPNIDGKGERDPIGRVSILEDTDLDGSADKSTLFLDELVLPRAIHVCNGGALVASEEKLWFAKDTTGDGIADHREIVDEDYIESGNPEHQPNGLLRGIDNWIYSAKSDQRYRYVDGEWIKQSTEFRGQWGITQDDFGRLYYNVNYSQLHVDYFPPNASMLNEHFEPAYAFNQQLATNQFVFTLRPNTGVNRGYRPGILDERGHLREFTSACAPLIYRDHALFGSWIEEGDRNDSRPESFTALVCDPAANLVKRNLVWEEGAQLRTEQAYPDREFLVSTDERFRPVWLSTSPDGSLFVADMYRGINQHRQYMTTHLRNEVLSRDLQDGINYGRIWRIRKKDIEPRRFVDLNPKSATELVNMLLHPSGQVRDSAQRLLSERQDSSIVNDLLFVARGEDEVAAIHALWTLEALLSKSAERQLYYGKADFERWVKLCELVQNAAPAVAVHGTRVASLVVNQGSGRELELLRAIRSSRNMSDPRFRIQAALTVGQMHVDGFSRLLTRMLDEEPTSGLLLDAVLSAREGVHSRVLTELVVSPRLHNPRNPTVDWSEYRDGRDVVIQSLSEISVRTLRSSTYELLLALAVDQAGTAAWRRLPIINGILANRKMLERQPIRLDEEPILFRQLAENSDPLTKSAVESLVAVSSWPGHEVKPVQRRRLRPLDGVDARQFLDGRRIYGIACAACHGVAGGGVPNMAPPLMDSNWVRQSPERVALVVLHGLEGPIEVNGKTYKSPQILPNMPAVDSLSDADLAAVVSYVVREFGNRNVDFGGMDVTILKNKIQRATPWKPEELKNLDD